MTRRPSLSMLPRLAGLLRRRPELRRLNCLGVQALNAVVSNA